MSGFACETAIFQEIDASNEIGILIPVSFAGCRKHFFDNLFGPPQEQSAAARFFFMEALPFSSWTGNSIMNGMGSKFHLFSPGSGAMGENRIQAAVNERKMYGDSAADPLSCH